MSEKAYLEVAREAARSAGGMIREETKRPHTVSRKHGFDFVTEVDRRSEEIIRGIILSAFRITVFSVRNRFRPTPGPRIRS